MKRPTAPTRPLDVGFDDIGFVQAPVGHQHGQPLEAADVVAETKPLGDVAQLAGERRADLEAGRALLGVGQRRRRAAVTSCSSSIDSRR